MIYTLYSDFTESAKTRLSERICIWVYYYCMYALPQVPCLPAHILCVIAGLIAIGRIIVQMLIVSWL